MIGGESDAIEKRRSGPESASVSQSSQSVMFSADSFLCIDLDPCTECYEGVNFRKPTEINNSSGNNIVKQVYR